jgi:hypothetical protein
MRKKRFPRLAYVRQLQTLYDELGWWRETYSRDGTDEQWRRPSWRYVARVEQLDQVQHDLMVAMNHLHGLEQLS